MNTTHTYWIPRGVIAAALIGMASIVPAAQDVEIPIDPRRDATVSAVERVLPAVVNIGTAEIVKVRDPFQDFFQQWWDPYHRQESKVGYSLGSGVVIDEEGYILTNDHVVRRADKIWIRPALSTNDYEAVIVASDDRTDLALLKIQAKPGEKFAAVRFASDDDLLLGETVLAIGNPFGLGGSVSRGILSSKSRMSPQEAKQLDIPNWLQTDASINPGNSGGPLVNLRGELIGISVAVLANAQGIGFAIPVRRVTEALSQMITPENSNHRLWFGARVRAGAGPLAVLQVQPESPAAKAGLCVNDLILQVNGKSPNGFIDYNTRLLSNPKKDVELIVRRGAELVNLSVKLLPENTFFNADLIEKCTGLRLQELTPELANASGLNTGYGFVVAAADKTASAQIQPGIFITSFDGRQPPDMAQVARLVHQKKHGETVQLGVLAARRQGNFISYRQGVLELPIR